MKPSIIKISKTISGILLMIIMFLAACQPTDYSASLKPILDAYIDAWNTGELDGLDQIIDADFVRSSTTTSNSNAEGLDSLKSVISLFKTGFPNRASCRVFYYISNFNSIYQIEHILILAGSLCTIT